MTTKRIIFVLVTIITLLLLVLILVAATVTLFQNPGRRTAPRQISFSELVNDVDAGRVHDILIRGAEIHGSFNDGRAFESYAPTDRTLVQRLYNKGVSITTQP